MRIHMSYGQELLERYLLLMLNGTPLEDCRPGWLGGLELDFFYPDLKLAFEFQGDQHVFFTETYGRHYLIQRERDKLKAERCKAEGVVLVQLYAIDLIAGRIRNRLKQTFRLLGMKMNRKSIYRDISSSDWKILNALDHESTSYRKLIIRRFDSVTARRSGRPKKEAKQRSREREERLYPPPSRSSRLRKALKRIGFQ